MKTRKTKIRRMMIRLKAYCAPLVLLCYPASVVAMFLVVGVLTSDSETKSSATEKVLSSKEITMNNK